MCLGVPGRILSIEADELRSASVEFGGIRRSVCLLCVPEAVVGDYVVVHVGFAISRIAAEDAQRTLALLQELADFEGSLSEPTADS